MKIRVTDYAGNTDTVTETVTVQKKASVSSTSVEHTGNGTAPSGTVNVKTRNEGGMLKFHLYRGSNAANRDLGAAGVDEWLTEDADGSKTTVAVKMHPINMQRLSNPGSTSPGRWPSQNKQADLSITPGAHLATFDMPDGSQFESDMKGATLTSDAQQFSPPRYDSQTGQLTYTVAAPHWKATGQKVSSNTNSGFYEAWIPSGMVSKMGISSPDELAGTYQSGGQSSSLTNMEVSQTASGGLYINVTGIHYSSGTVQLSADNTDPTADAGSDQTVTAGNSLTFDGSVSSDNRKISSYEWDLDGDGTYDDATGATVTHTYDSAGTRTVTVKVADTAGNSATDTATVDVSSTSDDGGGGGGGGGAGGAGGGGETGDTNTTEAQTETTVTETNATTNVAVTNAGNASVTVEVSAESETGNVSVERMSVGTNDTDDYTLNVSSHDRNPGTAPSPSGTDVGTDPVGYVEVDHSVSDDDVGTVSFEYSVATERLDERGLDPEDVSLYRYNDGSWQAVPTTYEGTVGGRATFESQAPGLSTFAIGATKRADVTVTDAALDSESVAVGETATVSVTVENTGSAEGSTTVELTAGGDVVASATVTVPAGETTTATLSATFEAADEYDLSVASADAGTLSVVTDGTDTPAPTDAPTETPTPVATPAGDVNAPTTTGSGPGFGVGLALLALAAAALLARRRR